MKTKKTIQISIYSIILILFALHLTVSIYSYKIIKELDAYPTFAFLFWSGFFIMGAGVAGLVFVLNTRVFKPIKELSRISERVSQGDLTETVQVEKYDEIGELSHQFNNMIVGLKGIIQETIQNSKHIKNETEKLQKSMAESRSSNNEVKKSIAIITDSAEKQLENFGTTKSSIHNIKQVIENVSFNAEEVSQTSKDTKKLAKKGNDYVDKTIYQMNLIDTTSKKVSTQMIHLKRKIEDIEKIVDMMTKLAKQTDLLAINAGLQAKKAGKHGIRFGVVAKEVKKLSEESSLSANKILEMMQEIKEETNETVYSIENEKTEVNKGKKIVMQTNEVFQNILSSAELSAQQIENVSNHAKQLLDETTDVTSVVNNSTLHSEKSFSSTKQVTSLIQKQTDSIDTLITAFKKLDDISNKLIVSVDKYKL